MTLLDDEKVVLQTNLESQIKKDIREIFENRLKSIPFIQDELRRKNPRFTLEFNAEDDRYRYVIVDTMYKLIEDLIIENAILIENLENMLKAKSTEFDDLSVLTEEYSKQHEAGDKVKDSTNDEAIILSFGEMHNSISDGALGKKIKVFTLMEMYYDRWAAPEDLGKILFYSEEEASQYIKNYVDKYHTLNFVPDEYRALTKVGYEEYYVVELKVAPSSINLNINCMVLA